MALRLGSLYVSLSADTGAFAKGMAGALKDLEKFSTAAKKASAEVAKVSAVMAGIGVAALKMASSVDGPTKTALDGLEGSTRLLAVQVADMLLPAVRELTAMFKTAAGVVAGLDPELKKQISSFAVMAAQVAVAAKAFSLFSGLAANVFGVLRAGFAMVAAVGVGPLLGIAAGVGIVIGAVLLLHRAWRKNWGGIQEATREVLEWLRSAFGQLATFFGKVWGFLVDGAADFVDGLLAVVDVMQEVTGQKLIDTNGMREGFGGLWKDLKSGSFLSEAFTFGESIGVQLVDGIKEEWAAIKGELGFDKLLKTSAPIASGRGMSQPAEQVGSMDTSSLATMSWFGAMQAEAVQADGAMTAIAVSFAASEISANEAEMAAKRQAEAGRQAAWAAAQMKQHTDEQARKVAATFKVVAASVTGALGEIGNLINTAMSAAASGGPWAALIAVIMEVVKTTASAMEFVGTAMNFVKQLAAMIEPLVKPIFDVFTDVLGMLSNILGPIIEAFRPFVDSFVSSIDNLLPIFAALGPLLQAIAPVIESIGSIVNLFTKALKPVFEVIGGIIKAIASVILGFLIFLNEIAAAFGDTKARSEADRMAAIIDKMWAPGATDLAVAEGKAAGAALRNADAQDEAARSAKKVAENLSNVPSGFNLANARYQSDMGITSATAYGGGGPTTGGNGGGVTINGDVQVRSEAATIGGVAADAAREAARQRGQSTGNSGTGGGTRGRGAWDGAV